MAVVRDDNEVYQAIRQGNAQLLKTLLEEGAQYANPDESGCTAMHVATEEGDVECLKVLVEAAKKRSSSSQEILPALCPVAKNGETPLSLSIKGGHSQALEVLLELYSSRKDVVEALYYACAKNKTEVVSILASRFPEHVNCAVNLQGKLISDDCEEICEPHYAIHKIIEHGNLESLEALLSAGADVNVRDGDELIPPMQLAITKGVELIAEALLEKNCSLTLRDGSGNTVLHVAALQGNEVILKLILDKAKSLYETSKGVVSNCCSLNFLGETPLSVAVSKGWHNIIDILTELYTYETLWHSGDPLHVACIQRDVTAMKMLLSKFPDLIHRPTCIGVYPLHTCAMFSGLAMMDCLLRAGADPNVLHHYNGCPHFSFVKLSNDNMTVLAKLVDICEGGQCRHCGDVSGHVTPLYCAASCGNAEVVKILLEYGADPSHEGMSHDYCPLYSTISKGFYDVANILADVASKTCGDGAILLAIRSSGTNLLRMLLEKGFSVQDYHYFWPCLWYEHVPDLPAVVRLLLEYGTKFDGMEQFFSSCFIGGSWSICVHAVGIMLKYGLLESISISDSVCCYDFVKRNRWFVDHATRLITPERVKLLLQHWPFASVTGCSIELCVPRLSNACRWKIRQSLVECHHVVSENIINRLPLPIPLKRFLFYENGSA